MWPFLASGASAEPIGQLFFLTPSFLGEVVVLKGSEGTYAPRCVATTASPGVARFLRQVPRTRQVRAALIDVEIPFRPSSGRAALLTPTFEAVAAPAVRRRLPRPVPAASQRSVQTP